MLPVIAGLLCAVVTVLNGDGCPIWPCEMWLALIVGLAAGGVGGYWIGRKMGLRR